MHTGIHQKNPSLTPADNRTDLCDLEWQVMNCDVFIG